MTWIATRKYLMYSASFKKKGGENKKMGNEANHRNEYTVVRYEVK